MNIHCLQMSLRFLSFLWGKHCQLVTYVTCWQKRLGLFFFCFPFHQILDRISNRHSRFRSVHGMLLLGLFMVSYCLGFSFCFWIVLRRHSSMSLTHVTSLQLCLLLLLSSFPCSGAYSGLLLQCIAYHVLWTPYSLVRDSQLFVPILPNNR